MIDANNIFKSTLVSSKNKDVPCAAFLFMSVRATITANVDRNPFDMNVFEPFIIQSSPSRLATVLIPCKSDPADGSVMPMQLIKDEIKDYGPQSTGLSRQPGFSKNDDFVPCQ